MGKFKRVLSAFLAVVVLTTVAVVPAIAAESPKQGTYQKTTTGSYMVSSTTGKLNVAKKKVTSKTIKTDTVANTVQINGKTYKVRKIGADCYNGCTKLTKINIKSKYIYKCNKKAFRGFKGKLSKVKVVITKNLSKKNFKKLKAALIKAGIKAKNISQTTKF